MVPAAQWGQAPPPPCNKVVAQAGQIQKEIHTQTEELALPMSSQNKAMCPWTGKKENKNAFAL